MKINKLVIYYILFLVGVFIRPLQAQNPENLSIDSLIIKIPFLMRSNEEMAKKYNSVLTTKSLKENNKHGIVKSVFNKAWLSYRHKTADETISSIDSALEKIPDIKTDTSLVNFYILKGQCFVKKAQFTYALSSFKQALFLARKRNDRESETGVLLSIGWAYMEDNKLPEAINFFNEVLLLHPEKKYVNRPLLLCNIASCYNGLNQFKKAEGFARDGIAAARSLSSTTDLANGLNILGRALSKTNRVPEAIRVLEEAAVVRLNVADPSMIASDQLELAELYLLNNQLDLAIGYAKKAEAISLENNLALKIAGSYEIQASAYEKKKQPAQAAEYYKKLLLQKELIAKTTYDEAMAEMAVQFDTQKKTTENLQLKKQNLEANLQNSNQQRWLALMAAGLFLLLGVGIYITKYLQNRYRLRLAMEQVAEQKRRTVAIIEAEEGERKKIAADLHDSVCQVLAAASLQINKAQETNPLLLKTEELINRATAEVRLLSHQVTPEVVLHNGLKNAILQTVDDLNAGTSGIAFSIQTHDERLLENNMQALVVYRCFQECMSNIIKHSKADIVNIQLNAYTEEIQLVIEDNGVGFDASEKEDGIGFKNMQSRLSAYDGNMVIDSFKGKGTSIIIQLPVNIQNDNNILS